MKKAYLIAAVMVCCLASAAFAQSPKVGETAPEFGSANWVMNPPETDKIADLAGEVIVIEHWGTR
ncbi:MAG: hypothetical protein AB7S36_15955 [Planctomycetota bacterium]